MERRQDAVLTFACEADRPGIAQRLEAAASHLDALFAGDRVHVAIPAKERAAELPVTDRPAYFAGCMATRQRWFALRGSKIHPLVDGSKHGADHRFLVFSGGLVAGSPGCLDVSVAFVPESSAQVERVLCEVGDALDACSARWTPKPLDTWQRVLQQGARDVQGLAARTPEGVRLQRLKPLAPRQPLRPEAGGWWNYWSARTAAFLGLQDLAIEPDFRDLARRTEAGAWLVQLGPDAFEPLAPHAMQRLAWLHERLPLLGVRDAA